MFFFLFLRRLLLTWINDGDTACELKILEQTMCFGVGVGPNSLKWGKVLAVGWSTGDQRWKNIQACEQCLCKFFSSSGKICAKLYGILLEKWGMLQLRAFIVIFWQICDYLWRFMVLFGTFMALYALFGTFGLLHCFVENSLLSQFTHFFG